MDRILYAVVPSQWEGRKLKDFLRARWYLSASLLITLKNRRDGIAVNGLQTPVNTCLRAGDRVSLSVGDDGADSGFEPTPMDLQILYEDSDVIVLNKPPFLPVHPSKGHCNDTLANGLTHYYHEKGETFVSRCVLRLDANTSGAVLFAKNAYAHDRIRHQLAEGLVKKEYRALVHGRPPFRGVINAPVYRPEQATVKRIVDPRGKPSVTEYITEKSNGTLSLLRVFPRTGRTHQIRLHLSHLGTPIVSDFLYGNEGDGILQRHGLHCALLSFLHPVSGKTVTVKAPLAPDMARWVRELPSAERYRTLEFHLRQTYGEKLVKLPINGGFSCPNRENGQRGCSFCSAGGLGESGTPVPASVAEQLERGKKLSQKWKNCRYIAYFQSYTNTYASVDTLRTLFTQALSHPDVALLSVATRPDCLPREVLDLLSELNQIKPVWVEFGLQTSHDATAARFHRGYDRTCYEEAVEALHRRNISVVTHLIFGLPGETREDMLRSVSYVGYYTDGIKLQMLQVLKGTPLWEEYQRSPFALLSREEYVSLICDSIALLPPHITVHRVTGDPPASLLAEPSWTLDKKRVLGEIHRELEARDIVQGSLAQKK